MWKSIEKVETRSKSSNVQDLENTNLYLGVLENSQHGCLVNHSENCIDHWFYIDDESQELEDLSPIRQCFDGNSDYAIPERVK
ncbi:hypothetical protein Tco_0761509 [Tanacetum coccineum]